ncbi:hypothetical protein FHT76_007820 [Rhizobium sp. BK176]|nr:hypothetical protein [Rhizobium sp. BK399]MCS4096099.1 hypothetical protein [Rhizobium sp. BK176]
MITAGAVKRCEERWPGSRKFEAKEAARRRALAGSDATIEPPPVITGFTKAI